MIVMGRGGAGGQEYIFPKTILNNKTRGHQGWKTCQHQLVVSSLAMMIESIDTRTDFGFPRVDWATFIFFFFFKEKQTEAFSFLPNEMLRLYRW